MAHSEVASPTSVGRKPSKPRKNEPFRMHIVLPGDLVSDVDAVVEQIQAADPLRRDVTRTYAISVLLTEAIKARKPKP